MFLPLAPYITTLVGTNTLASTATASILAATTLDRWLLGWLASEQGGTVDVLQLEITGGAALVRQSTFTPAAFLWIGRLLPASGGNALTIRNLGANSQTFYWTLVYADAPRNTIAVNRQGWEL